MRIRSLLFMLLAACPAAPSQQSSDDMMSDDMNETATVHVRVAVIGLTGAGLTLALDGEMLPVLANGEVSFVQPLTPGDTYAVTLAATPAKQECAVTNGSGLATTSDEVLAIRSILSG